MEHSYNNCAINQHVNLINSTIYSISKTNDSTIPIPNPTNSKQNQNGDVKRTASVQQGDRSIKGANHGKPNKFRIRRHKANARERNRMHGLNAALDHLRNCVPILSQSQKLSKIETIRLAKNYIEAMSEMLQKEQRLDRTIFAKILSNGLSEGTKSMIAGFMTINPIQKTFNFGHPKQFKFSVFEPNGLLKDFANTI